MPDETPMPDPDGSLVERKLPEKQFTVQDILSEIANRVDGMSTEIKTLGEKIRHFDQFREDILAQVDTISNAVHEAKLDGSPGGEKAQGQGQSSMPAINPDAIKGAVDAVNGLATNIFDMIYKWKMGTLADPMDAKKYEYGDRVMRRIANEEIGHTVKEIKKPVQEPESVREDKYSKMYVADHGTNKNIR